MVRKRDKLTKEMLHQLYNKEELRCRFPNEGELINYFYWEEELSQPQIAKILGCSKSTVGNKMRKHGIEA